MPKKLILPYLCLLYFINYLDRVNIGFAGPNGMSEELKLSATVFGFASGVFFIGYLLLEVPSNLALHRFGARRRNGRGPSRCSWWWCRSRRRSGPRSAGC